MGEVMRNHYTKMILSVILLSGFWYMHAGKGETMDAHTKHAVTGSALPQIDTAQPEHTETATFALG